MIDCCIFTLRNESGGDVTLDSLVISSGQTVTIWDPGNLEAKTNLDSMRSTIGGQLNAELTQGNLVLEKDGVDQSLVDSMSFTASLADKDTVTYYIQNQSTVRFQESTAVYRSNPTDPLTDLNWPQSEVMLSEMITTVLSDKGVVPATLLVEGEFSTAATATCDVKLAIVDDDDQELMDLGVVATLFIKGGVTGTTLNSGPYTQIMNLAAARYRIQLWGRCTEANAFKGWAQLIIQSFSLPLPAA